MPNFNINVYKVAKDNLLRIYRTPKRLDRIRAMLKPLELLYNEFTNLRALYTYKCRINGTVIYLEMALNDRFDNTSRQIYIETASYEKLFIYKKSESRPPIILYKKWDATTSFAVGKFCWYNGLVYQANALALNKVPGIDPQWTVTARLAPVLRMKSNFTGEVAFIVWVPSTLIYSDAEMRSLINFYKMAGYGYEIMTF